MSRYSGDPRWIVARFNSTCAETGKKINKGDDCVYYPREKKTYHKTSKAAEGPNRCAWDDILGV